MRTKTPEILFLLAVATFAVVLVVWAVGTAMGPGDSTYAGPAAGPGEPRDVNLEALRERIRRGELSDHEALFQHSVEDATDGEPD